MKLLSIDQLALKTMLISKQLCTVEKHYVLACLSTLFYSSWTIATFPFFPIILFCQSSVFSHKLIIHFIHYGDQHPKKYPWSTVGDDTVDQVPIMGCLSTGGDDTVDQLRWCMQWSSHLFFPTQYLLFGVLCTLYSPPWVTPYHPWPPISTFISHEPL